MTNSTTKYDSITIDVHTTREIDVAQVMIAQIIQKQSLLNASTDAIYDVVLPTYQLLRTTTHANQHKHVRRAIARAKQLLTNQ